MPQSRLPRPLRLNAHALGYHRCAGGHANKISTRKFIQYLHNRVYTSVAQGSSASNRAIRFTLRLMAHGSWLAVHRVSRREAGKGVGADGTIGLAPGHGLL
ncbi:hypothetical protein ACO22_08038 [Paracoccidioides brasiliensis]|uniref:Uncharacterized protein n=1 Tax=Paracoccidioides brasiliensis TaxID=121759 RepID=A0A1D2J2Y8_PARBR|nr:hypothetical protein ACO22_08038 [Paracoccidioides brasiliensis]